MRERPTRASRPVHIVAVIGAGTMGHGIAQVAASAGCQVILCDVSAERVEAGMASIRAHLAAGVEKGKVTAGDRDAALARLGTAVSVAAAVAGADLVVEAVPENLDLKRRVLAEISAAAAPAAILATNTSSLPLRSLASAVEGPGRFLGMHFFNPPPFMPLVEIITAEATTADSLGRVRELVIRLGKTGIVVRDSPGFATSRLGLAIGLEAMRMLEEGVAGVADIDRAMELGYRHPMGPLKLTDLVGLDVRLGISEVLAKELDGARFAPPGILRRKVAAGHLGKKSGLGFYRWTEKGPEAADE